MAAKKVMNSLADRMLSLDQQIDAKNNDEIDTYAFVESMKNINTKTKTKSNLKRVQEFFRSVGKERNFTDIPPKNLDTLLARAFLSMRKQDGSEYEPDTIKGIQASVHRHLTENNYQYNILVDQTFKHSRDVISSKRKHLKSSGMGNKRQRSDPFTDDEMVLLRQNKMIGTDNPESLINTLWLNNTIHFGLRGRQEHLTMLWGDIELKNTSTGTEYLEFTERSTKTRNGITTDPRAFTPKMFAAPDDEYCPVKTYKFYAEKRPEGMLDPESRFYIAINPNYGRDSKNGLHWFIKNNMGVNRLGKIAKIMSEKANLSGRHTNHSARKTSITKLLEAKVHQTEVAQLSGHKNIMSLNHYNTVSLSKQQNMSNVLHNVNTSSTTTTTKLQTSNACTFDGSVSDQELLQASQEIDCALQEINFYENAIFPKDANVVNLPLVHDANGSLRLRQSFNPENFFVNCTFNSPVSINFN